MPRYGPLLQTQPQGGQGQHGEVPLENASVAAGHGATQLCRSGGRRAGRPGRSAAGAARGSDHTQPGGAAPPRHTQKLPRTGHPHMAVSTVWAGAGTQPWQHSTPERTSPMLTTPLSTTGLSESARPLTGQVEGPLHFRRQGGTLFRRRSAGGCRFEGSPGKSASIGTQRRSTWKL